MAWLRVAAKDARVELRARDALQAVLLTGLLVVVVGLLAFHDVEERASVAAGVLWIGLAFAASLGFARAFGAERDRGTLDTLLALPVERGHVYLGKVASSFLTVLVVALVLVPVYLVAGREPVPAQWPALLLLLALGALGLAATGGMLSMLAAQARSRDALLPVLLAPLAVPLLLAAVHGTMDLLANESFAQWRPELLLLVGYDVAFLAASTLLFEAATGA